MLYDESRIWLWLSNIRLLNTSLNSKNINWRHSFFLGSFIATYLILLGCSQTRYISSKNPCMPHASMLSKYWLSFHHCCSKWIVLNSIVFVFCELLTWVYIWWCSFLFFVVLSFTQVTKLAIVLLFFLQPNQPLFSFL